MNFKLNSISTTLKIFYLRIMFDQYIIRIINSVLSINIFTNVKKINPIQFQTYKRMFEPTTNDITDDYVLLMILLTKDEEE